MFQLQMKQRHLLANITSLSKYNGKTLDQFGYSNTEKALYKMLKFSGMLNIYKQLHPKYSEERYELCQIQ